MARARLRPAGGLGGLVAGRGRRPRAARRSRAPCRRSARAAPSCWTASRPSAAWAAAPADGVSAAIAAEPGRAGRRCASTSTSHGGGGYAVAHARRCRSTLPANYALHLPRPRRRAAQQPRVQAHRSRPATTSGGGDRRDFELPARVADRDACGSATSRSRGGRPAAASSAHGRRDRVRDHAPARAARARCGSTTSRCEPLPARRHDARRRSSAATSAARGSAAARALDGDPRPPGAASRRAAPAADARPRRRRASSAGSCSTGRPAARRATTRSSSPTTASVDARARRSRGGNGGRDYALPARARGALRCACALERAAAAGRRRSRELARAAARLRRPRRTHFFARVARERAARHATRAASPASSSTGPSSGSTATRTRRCSTRTARSRSARRAFSIEPFLRDRRQAGHLGRRRATRSAGRTATCRSRRSPGGTRGAALRGHRVRRRRRRRRRRCVARYRVDNPGATPRRGTLYLALRPSRSTRRAQFLNTPGGVAPSRRSLARRRVVRVNGDRGRRRADAAGRVRRGGVRRRATSSEYLRAGPPAGGDRRARPARAAPRARSRTTCDLAPGRAPRCVLEIPLHEPPRERSRRPCRDAQRRDVARERRARGRRRVARARSTASTIDAARLAAGRRATRCSATLACILVNRDGPAIQPGSRSYERSWIRDGALTSVGAAAAGQTDEVREFVAWFAAYQYADGKVPCCVDARGADPVPEHDSHGEFIYLSPSTTRYTRRPRASRVATVAARRRARSTTSTRCAQQRTTDAYRAAGERALLRPAARSRSATRATRPSRCTRTGTTSSRCAASRTRRRAGARRWATRATPRLRRAARRRSRTDLAALAPPRRWRAHGIDYLPGCADLGDFDATSTTIALDPVGDDAALSARGAATARSSATGSSSPAPRRRATGRTYTPYELRNVGRLVRLGWRERAHALLDWFLADRRPPGWNAVGRGGVARSQRAAASSATCRTPGWARLRPRPADHVRVRARPGSRNRHRAGISPEWAARGVSVRRLPTTSGVLSYTLRVEGPDTVRVRLAGDLAVPPGGLVITSPLDRPIRRATVDGKAIAKVTASTATVDRCPADVVLHYETGGDGTADSSLGHGVVSTCAAVGLRGGASSATVPLPHGPDRTRSRP